MKTYCARVFTQEELQWIAQLIENNPQQRRTALSRLVSGRRWQVPDVRVGMVKMGGRWKLVTDVR